MSTMTTTTRKAVISSFSGRDDLSTISVVEAPLAPPAKGEVRVQVFYAGFSGADISMRLGVYPMQSKAPLSPGYSLVGRVLENGEGCAKFKVGDVVAAVTKYGADAELANVKESLLLGVTGDLARDDSLLQQVAALSLDWATAYGMVERAAEVKKGQKVFVHGVSGAVGCGVAALCHARGAEVYGTASERNHKALAEVGVTSYEYKTKDWIAAMQARGGVDAVFDPLGFTSWDESWSILNPTGILVGYGGNQGILNKAERLPTPYVPMLKLFARNLVPFSKKRTSFYYINPTGQEYYSDFAALLELLKTGAISVPIRAVWDLNTEGIRAAHQSWGQLGGIGSLLIRVGSSSL